MPVSVDGLVRLVSLPSLNCGVRVDPDPETMVLVGVDVGEGTAVKVGVI